ncbi:unnamed protein product [Coregonus sp. 'balchen']|nr:unnamed protein product [Coregonus sp. 'balchen']
MFVCMCCGSELRDDKPVFEKRRLMWEENMQMHSKFLDRKEELKAEHAYPELHAMMADLLRLLLLLKPSGVFLFARKDFSPFPSCRPPGGGIFNTSSP